MGISTQRGKIQNSNFEIRSWVIWLECYLVNLLNGFLPNTYNVFLARARGKAGGGRPGFGGGTGDGADRWAARG